MLYLRTLTAFLILTAASRADDWPQWLGPNRNSVSSETVAVWKTPPRVAWRQVVGDGFSVPVIASGRVFLHAKVKDKEEEEVLALDAKTGKPLWREGYGRAPFISAVGSGPRATPAVLLDRVYTYGITGVLSCFQADTGKRLWQVEPYKKLGANLPGFGVCCSPLVVGNRVIVAVGGIGSSVVAFDADNGEIVWKALDEPASTCSPILFAASSPGSQAMPNAVLATTLRVVALNPLDGGVAWEYPLVFQPAGASPTPVAAGDVLITSSMTNGGVGVQVGAKEGSPVASRAWQNPELSGYFSSPVVVGDLLFVVSNTLKPIPKAMLRCVSAKTGKELWKKSGIGYFHAGLLALADGKILVLDDAGLLRLFAADAKEYRELASAKVCSSTFANPALADGRLYVRDGKELICLEMAP